MNIKKMSLKAWHNIVCWNAVFFPFIAIAFVVFALLEKYRPGFFTFYIGENWIFVIVILSCILRLFHTGEESKKQTINIFLSVVLLVVLTALFSVLLYVNIANLALWLKLVSTAVGTFAFAIFGFALFFPNTESQKRIISPFLSKSFQDNFSRILFYVICIVILIFLVGLSYLAVTDPLLLQKIL
jgi:hypothetical protein